MCIFSLPLIGAFRLYDVDNDGYITREEMYNIVDAIYQMVVRLWFRMRLKFKSKAISFIISSLVFRKFYFVLIIPVKMLLTRVNTQDS